MLTSKEEATREKVKIWKKVGVELRYMDFLPTKFSVIDNQGVTIRFTKEKKYISLWIQNRALAKIMKSHFEELWEKGKKV